MSAVRSPLVVKLPPMLDEHPGFGAIVEPFTIQQFAYAVRHHEKRLTQVSREHLILRCSCFSPPSFHPTAYVNTRETMLKGLAITPPIIGRISIGRVVEKNGKRLPEKDDQFTITTQVQNRDGWMLHPVDTELRKANTGKLRTIPVRFLFADPDLNLRAEYSCFDRQTGRPVCVGDGETCRRAGNASIEELPCPSPDRNPMVW